MSKQHDLNQLIKGYKLVKLLENTKGHDRKKCNCGGCLLFSLTRTVFHENRLFEAIEDWKEMEPEEFHRSYQRTLQYGIDHKCLGEPIIVWMGKKSPQGLLRDI